MEIETSTNILPIVDPTDYGVDWAEPFIDEDDNITKLDSCVLSVSEQYIKDALEDLVHEFGGSINVSDFEIYRPRFYNYEGDAIYFTMNISDDFIDTIYSYIFNERYQDFRAFLKDRYSSYSGFISFYPDTVDTDEPVTEKLVLQMIAFLLKEDGHDCHENDSYYGEFIDDLTQMCEEEYFYADWYVKEYLDDED